jgi:DNA-binding NtrC family response regulator
MADQPWQWFGLSPSQGRLRHEAELFAATPWPILITGERGTGKTALARVIHCLSGREGAFTKQCAPEFATDTGIAELHGHSAGAFTGAVRDRKGLLESANRGTFFLDEIGVASPGLQQLLLRLLEDPEVRRMGDDRPRPLGVRFIAATNEDLEAAIQEGRFRFDLLDRFGYFRLKVPALRERPEEIVPLALGFLRQAAECLGKPTPDLSPDAAELLERNPWPGNVRQLQFACRIAVTMTPAGGRITAASLPEALQRPNGRLTTERVREWIAAENGNLSRAARKNGYTDRHLRRILNEDTPDAQTGS